MEVGKWFGNNNTQAFMMLKRGDYPFYFKEEEKEEQQQQQQQQQQLNCNDTFLSFINENVSQNTKGLLEVVVSKVSEKRT